MQLEYLLNKHNNIQILTLCIYYTDTKSEIYIYCVGTNDRQTAVISV